MGGFLLRAGPWWDNSCVVYARRSLQHYSPILPLVAERDLTLDAIGGQPVAGFRDGWSFYALGLDEAQVGDVIDLAQSGGIEEIAPGRWQGALLLGLHRNSREFLIARGEFCPHTVRYAWRGGSCFSAPEFKAFSEVRGGVKQILAIPAGHSVRFGPSHAKPRVTNAECSWPAPPPTDRDYAQAQREFRALLEAATRETLATCPRPMAISLSGGLDSAIAACLVVQAGEKPPAYSVWLEQDDGQLPSDIQGARLVAQHLGLEHIEVPVGIDELESLLDETIRRAETFEPVLVESGMYHTRLCERLKADGFASFMTGNGFDGLLGSFGPLGGIEDDETFHKTLVRFARRAMNNDAERLIRESYSLEALGLLSGEATQRFVRELPRAFIARDDGGSFLGKLIARDMFRGELPEQVVQRPKQTPDATTGASALMRTRHGRTPARHRHYRLRYSRLLRPAKGDFLDHARLKLRRYWHEAAGIR